MISYLENTLRYSGDEELGKAVLYETMFAGTPYGHIPAGRVKSLKSITLDDVRAFYGRYYVRPNFVIGLGGGYDAENARFAKEGTGTTFHSASLIRVRTLSRSPSMACT